MRLLKNKELCCGCSICSLICPVNAISMEKDIEGFIYPFVKKNLCINCNKCLDICSFKKNDIIPINQDIYGVRHKKIQEVTSSRSGGMFTTLVDYTLSKQGIIYGAGYAGFKVAHKRFDNKSDCQELKGSKYVQSDTKGIYDLIKKDLKNNKWVLFSGTPCQVHSLSVYLQKENTKKLILCDLVCHGVPSPKIWEDYIKYIEKKHDDTVINANFRDKEYGWNTHYESFVLSKKKRKVKTEYFRELFLRNFILRPSCYNCKYCNFDRCSDITLGDFWGWEKSLPHNFNSDNKGVSLVFVNTEKGKQIFESIKKDIQYIKSNKKNCIQKQLKSPPEHNHKREQFWKDYLKHGLKFVVFKYIVLNKEYFTCKIKKELKFFYSLAVVNTTNVIYKKLNKSKVKNEK